MMRRSVKREFFGNVIPSMIAFAFTGVYAIVDGFFVGRNVGDAGLAAINVAYPLVGGRDRPWHGGGDPDRH